MNKVTLMSQQLADPNEATKRLHAARIDELADSNEPAMKNKQITVWPICIHESNTLAFTEPVTSDA